MSTTHPVDSTHHRCCQTVGQHGRDCAAASLSDGNATMPTMNNTPTHTADRIRIPAGATSVGEWEGGARYFSSSRREVEAEWMTLGVAVDGEQQQTGEVRRFIDLSSDTGHGPTDIAGGPLSVDEARQFAAALTAAADEADELDALEARR